MIRRVTPNTPPTRCEVETVDFNIATGGFTDEERGAMAGEVWAEVGLPNVSRWLLLRRGDRLEYRLYTPDDEVRLGASLLNYQKIRTQIFDYLGVLLPQMEKAAWEPRAVRLRKLVRELWL